ncbi:MAG: diacylglycerol kinase family lipid kinase [Sphingobacteriales bacterium JAD_PAG50586_3]|nr:MAG: diacylglycerol kinase family lipid kinase [Sphingobacteriales bacterium JAD_PAG50586_3]
MAEQYFIVVNPLSGGGRSEKLWPKIVAKLKAEGLDYTYKFTERSFHAYAIVQDAIAAGHRTILVVGGDGSLNEAANAIFDQTMVNPSEVKLGLISVGTGNDWGKTTQVPADFAKCIDIIKAGKTFKQDVGKAFYQENGTEKHRYFVNIAGFAYDAYVVENTMAVNRKGAYGKLYYQWGIFKCLFSYKNTQVKISSENGTLMDEEVFNGTVAICRYNGGGMIPNPHAVPDDGIFDITAYSKISRIKVATSVGKLYNGTVETLKEAHLFTAKEVKIDSNPGIRLETDGELLGTTPFRFEMKQRALNVFSPLAAS